jgi:hypothetical protein
MPKTEDAKLEVPESITAFLDPVLKPERISINRLAFPSPFEEYPGKIITPLYLDAGEYHNWWKKAGKGQPDDDERHFLCFEWECRFHLVKKWDMEELDADHLNPDPLTLPDFRIALWLTAVTQPILKEATSLPNLQRPSNAIESQQWPPAMAELLKKMSNNAPGQ